MPTYLADWGLGERSSDPYAPVLLFRVRRLTQTLTSARLPRRAATALRRTDTANGCLVARTISTTQTRTERLKWSKPSTLGPQRGRTASKTAALLWNAASDELYASYPFSPPPHSKAALALRQQPVRNSLPRFPETRKADRLFCRLTFAYHGCPLFPPYFLGEMFLNCLYRGGINGGH